MSDLPAGRGAWVSDISPDGRTLLVTVWSSADLNNIYSYDLTTEGAELESFIVGPERVWAAKFVGRSDYVIHEEDFAGHAHNIFLRKFPDTGAVWSFVGPPEGYRGNWWHGPFGGVVAFDGEVFVVEPLGGDRSRLRRRLSLALRLVEFTPEAAESFHNYRDRSRLVAWLQLGWLVAVEGLFLPLRLIAAAFKRST